MLVELNGRQTAFPEGARLRDAVALRCHEMSGWGGATPPPDAPVVVLNGWQTDEDGPLRHGDSVVVVPRGEFPAREELASMLRARNAPELADRLAAARVGIAGLGGIGSHVAVFLARAGVGHLHLVDFDVVEPTNLNRQAYRTCHIGMPKAEALRRELAEIQPWADVCIDIVKVTEACVRTLFAGDAIVCEAFDHARSKAMLVNTLLEQCPDKVIVAASGMAGIGSCNAVTTRKAARRLYICGDGVTEGGPGQSLMAPRVAVCAGHQANMILRLIAGESEA